MFAHVNLIVLLYIKLIAFGNSFPQPNSWQLKICKKRIRVLYSSLKILPHVGLLRVEFKNVTKVHNINITTRDKCQIQRTARPSRQYWTVGKKFYDITNFTHGMHTWNVLCVRRPNIFLFKTGQNAISSSFWLQTNFYFLFNSY
jgi:hypothetical protein